MRITVLTENTSPDPRLTAEHGLSLYIETETHNILFDAGQTHAFAENAEKLGIDLAAVDIAVLSHGHYDHAGGLGRFLELNDHAPVYLSRHAFRPYYNGREKYIGVDPALEGNPRLVYADDVMRIGEGLTLLSCNGRCLTQAIDPFGLNMVEDGEFLPDDFRHEQYLLIREGEKQVLISGCSHKGIVNIADWFSPDVLVGGFHFSKLSPDLPKDRRRLERAAEALLGHPTVYYTGHCTGAAPYAFLKERMGDRLEPLYTGRTMMI